MASPLKYERKRALVIGIDKYKTRPLDYCVSDAKELTRVLEEIGFKVTLKQDIDSSSFQSCVEKFTKDILPTDLILFYFAGHAVSQQHVNYLVCSDDKVPLDIALGAFCHKKPSAVLLMIDCFRKNFGTPETSTPKALLTVYPSPGTCIAYTSFDSLSTEESRDGIHGYFLQSLLPYITYGGIDYIEVLTSADRYMRKLTNGLKSIQHKNGLRGPLHLKMKDHDGHGKGSSDPSAPMATPRDAKAGAMERGQNQQAAHRADPNQSMEFSDGRKDRAAGRGQSDFIDKPNNPERGFREDQSSDRFSRESNQKNPALMVSPRGHAQHREQQPHSFDPNSSLGQAGTPGSYRSEVFGIRDSTDRKVQDILNHLRHKMRPMNKRGPMSGSCIPETDQMENFLKTYFSFRNIDGKYIVSGVRAFELRTPVKSIKPGTVIRFPSDQSDGFRMTVDEIIRWQKSYVVYTYQGVPGLNTDFLQKALRGKSEDGKEAFRMKFVVRISDCPIVMDFNSQIIRRPLNEDFPNRIKLVSVTGVDFAGRKHDVDDIRTYVTNWRDVFEIDRNTDLPAVFNGRDFYPKRGHPPAVLDEKRLYDDLVLMVALRLRACDLEKVQIVIETGIGLGVFSGKHFGIDRRVRQLSAQAIRHVLQTKSNTYQHIRAVVLALPIFSPADSSGRQLKDTYDYFVEEFVQTQYNGPIPVLIIDHDLHELALTLALGGFCVSELNPADSHGVFGEYWQNHGPAVEEKLALTTLGLLVQHHLSNPHVLDPNRYKFL